MESLLLIAGCGYTGAALLQSELDKGRAVIAMSRSPFSLTDVSTRQCTSFVCDFTDTTTFPRELPWIPPVAVFLVSPNLRQGGDGEDYLRALNQWNVWCSEIGITRKILASSIGVYEQQDGGWVSEKSLLTCESDRTRRLLEAEWVFMLHTEGMKEAGVILRIGGIYGPSRHRFLQSMATEIIRKSDESGGDASEGSSWLNLIYRDDLVSAIQACAKGLVEQGTRVSGIYNLTDGSPALKSEVAHYVNNLCQEKNISRPTAVGNKPPSRSQANRKVSSELFRSTFLWSPAVSDYRVGYSLILEAMKD